MCGRFLLLSDIEILEANYGIHCNSSGINTSIGEVFPTNQVPVIINDGKKQLTMLNWGFILYNGALLINARCETITTKPTFSQPFYTNRCIIPANSFFEWHQDSGKKVKYSISLKSSPLFSMAGIYKTYMDKNNTPKMGFVIITTSANTAMSDIHNRMPVILTKQGEDIWLGNDISAAKNLLHPYDDSEMTIQKV